MFSKLKSPDGFYGWVNLAVMFFFNIAMYPMMFTFMICLPIWRGEFGWSMGDMTVAQSISLILSGLTAPMVGIFIMKKGPRIPIVIGNLISSIALVLLSFQQHIWHLWIDYGVVLGLGISIGGMLAMMTVVNNWFVMKRSIALAVSMGSMGLAGSVMIPGMVKLVELIAWRNTYLVLAAITLLFCVIMPALFIKDKPEDLGQVPDGPASTNPTQTTAAIPKHPNLYKTPVEFTAREALKTLSLWLLVAYVILQFFAMQGLITYQFSFLTNDIKMTNMAASFVVGLFSAVMAISQFGIGFLGLKFKMHSLATISTVIAIAGYIILLVAEKNLEFPHLIYAYCVLLGIGFGVSAIALGNLVPDYFGRTEFPKIMGYTMPITTVLSSFGIFIFATIRDTTGSYMPAFQLSLVAMVIALICIILAKPPVHPSLK